MRKVAVLSVILIAAVFSVGCGPALQVTFPKSLPEGVIAHLDSGGEAIIIIYGFSPDGARLLCRTSENTSVFDASTGKAIFTVPGGVQAIRRGKALIHQPHKITLLDFAGEQVEEVFHSYRGNAAFLFPTAALSDDGRMAVAGNWDASRLLDTTTGWTVLKLPRIVAAPCFSPDGKTLASVIDPNTICIWDVQTGRKVQTIRHERDNVKAPPGIHRIRFSADGKAIVCFESWSIYTTPTPVSHYMAKARAGCIPIQIANGTTVYSTSGKKLLQTTGWPIVSGDRKRLLLPDESRKKFIVYDFSTGQKDSEIPAYCNSPLAVAPGSNLIAQVQTSPAQIAKFSRYILRFWDTTTAKLIREIPLSDGPGWGCAALSGDGKTVAVQDGRRIRIINVETGKMLLEMQGRGAVGGTGQVVFSPDGTKSAVRFGPTAAVIHLSRLQ